MGRKKEQRKSGGSAGQNKKAGEEFLAKNAVKEDVIVLASGLQYAVIREGDGMCPRPNSRIIIDQRASLLNGTVLIDTYKEGKPSEFSLNEGIEGLQEGIQLMKTGSRYKFWVPSELGWGKKGTPGGKIGPYAILIFDIALLETD